MSIAVLELVIEAQTKFLNCLFEPIKPLAMPVRPIEVMLLSSSKLIK